MHIKPNSRELIRRTDRHRYGSHDSVEFDANPCRETAAQTDPAAAPARPTHPDCLAAEQTPASANTPIVGCDADISTQLIPLVLLVLTGVFLLGCQPATITQDGQLPASKLQRGERWDTIFLLGSKVGHVVTTWQPAEGDDNQLSPGQLSQGQLSQGQLVYWKQEMQLNVKRFGDETSQAITLESWESSDGGLVRCEWSLQSGATKTEFSIVREANRLRIHDRVSNETSVLDVDWQDTNGGYFGVEQSLLQDPLDPGESRAMTVLMPILNTVGTVRLTAREIEPTETPAGPLDLLRIENVLQLDAENTLQSTMWADPAGRILKTHMPLMQQETYYTDRQTAMAKDTNRGLDFGLQTIVPAAEIPADIHRRNTANYVVRLVRDNPSQAFSNGVSQTVQPVDDRTAKIQIFGGGRQSRSPAGEEEDLPTEMDLRESGLVQSTDPRIVAMANGISAGVVADGELAEDENAWDLAAAIEGHVHEFIQDKNFNRPLSSAVEVLETRQGDCTEHATLLAALCRARKIPARVALGLVYSPRDQGFAYHMWNEVWIDDLWRPLDATMAQGGIGAGHLKVTHSRLAGANALGTLLPVIRVLGQLEIEYVD